MKIPNWLKTVLSFALAFILVYFSVKSISPEDWQKIKEAVGKTQWFWIAFSILLAILSHSSRAIRWKQMLDTLKPVRLSIVFAALSTGYLVNMALPRAGEISRAGIVNRYEKVSFDKIMGTIFNDRIIDVLFLFIITALALLLQWSLLENYATELFGGFQEKLSGLNYTLLIIIGIVALLVVGLLATQFKKLWEKVMGVLKNFGQGISAIWKVDNKFMFIFHSLFIWAMYYAMIYACMQATDFTAHLSPTVGLVLLAFGTWGFIATPGGIGAYPIVIASILALYGVDKNLGLAFGWIIWAAQTLLNLTLGAISVAYLGVKKAQIDE